MKHKGITAREKACAKVLGHDFADNPGTERFCRKCGVSQMEWVVYCGTKRFKAEQERLRQKGFIK